MSYTVLIDSMSAFVIVTWELILFERDTELLFITATRSPSLLECLGSVSIFGVTNKVVLLVVIC